MFLRDRKKTEKTARWVAIIMVVVFALGFVLLSVGSSAGGNVFLACENNNSVTEDSYAVQQEKYYLGVLEDNPNDTAARVGLAQLYASEAFNRVSDAIAQLDQVIVIDSSNIPARMEKARILQQQMNDTDQALLLLAEAAAIAPNDPEVFLQLGLAAKAAGQNAQAIAAWTRYLELAPGSSLADTIRGEIAALQALPPVTSTEPAATPEAAVP